MRRLSPLVPAGALTYTLVTVPFGASAHAAAGIGCTPILDNGLVAEICTSAMESPVTGSLTVFGGLPLVNVLTLSKCNAAGTTCTLLAQTTTQTTLTAPAKPGKYYRTCADFSISTVPGGQVRHYDGCSPLVQTPAEA